jgi:hypothetical protein
VVQLAQAKLAETYHRLNPDSALGLRRSVVSEPRANNRARPRTMFSFVRRYNSATTPTQCCSLRALEGVALAAAGGPPRSPLPPHNGAAWWRIRSSFGSFSFASLAWIGIWQIGAQRDDACSDPDVTGELARSSSHGVAVGARWIWCWCGHPAKPLMVRDAARILTRLDSDGSDFLRPERLSI